MKPITVLIVDDCIVQRHLFTQMLEGVPDIKVLDTAANAQEAREKIKQLDPDVLTLDITMPGMDGIDFLEKIMTLRPMPVIMLSAATEANATETIRALELGAFDYIGKLGNIQNGSGKQSGEVTSRLRQELITKIRAAAVANIAIRSNGQAVPTPVKAEPAPDMVYTHVIAIGSSTGGVEALRHIFMELPADSPPVLVVQHMPEHFTPAFAARLNEISRLNVREARNGTFLQVGHAYIAPGNSHMKIYRKGDDLYCRLLSGEAVSGHRPSVDVLFNSVAETVGGGAIGVILTGMGKDGSSGMLRMRECGAYNIGQSESSCVIYGMPRAATAIGAVHVELPLPDIVGHIQHHYSSERKAHRA